MAYNVYSLPDTRTVLYHPDADAASLYRGDAAESPGQGFRPNRDPSCVSFAGDRYNGAAEREGDRGLRSPGVFPVAVNLRLRRCLHRHR